MLFVLASCTPIVDQRGHNEEQADYSQIIEGQTTQDDVRALLGSPSTESTFGEKIWYYVSTKKETRGMLAPEVVDQHVVAVHFNEDGTVKSIDNVKRDSSEAVVYVDKETPTEGRELGIMEQLMGNFGKFSTPGREINPRDLGR